MEIDINLVEQIFIELSCTIDSKARSYSANGSTFRDFTDNEKHLLDVTDSLTDEMRASQRFYSTMNRAREYFLGNVY